MLLRRGDRLGTACTQVLDEGIAPIHKVLFRMKRADCIMVRLKHLRSQLQELKRGQGL